ncbi:GerMN domain-containing protein [Nocardioides gilvus]|uniref:GerMN domain-containing protein n=1 Tax=Nocardioides gilvus TaxID=1735589 RepID=UPI000D746A1B|nr:GerMN domain-containing protein [Nocardioides gilvus]
MTAHRTRARAGLLVGLLATLLLSACVQMPTSGPVVSAGQGDGDETEVGAFYEPRGPVPGATGVEVVAGFLEAMKAAPVKTSVAAEFLTESAQRRWRPERGSVTYTDLDYPEGQSRVRAVISGAQAYDERGTWSHVLDESESEIVFPMVMEGDEWRIDDAPDALIVPESWFNSWFESASLHFLDPSGSVLVPEPVFVPTGDQFATSLVRGLLSGPPDERISRSAFPEGLRVALNSVPIDGRGMAEVALEGAPTDRTDDIVSEEMVAQLTWTLRQEPRIRSLRVTIDGRSVTLPGGGLEIPVDAGRTLSPTGSRASDALFAFDEGRLVRGGPGELEATRGPLGAPGGEGGVGADADVSRAAVSVDGSRVAVVSPDGSTLSTAPVDDADADVVPVVSGATDLLTPVFDAEERLWMLDRTAGGARVSMLSDGAPTAVRVPGVSGENVRAMLVSRDASRLVAVISGPTGDRLVFSRLIHDGESGGARGTRARDIDLDLDRGRRLTDLGWVSPVELAVLTDITEDLAQVLTVPVSARRTSMRERSVTRVRDGATDLASSPLVGTPLLVVTDGAVRDLTDPARVLTLGSRITWFGFPS